MKQETTPEDWINHVKMEIEELEKLNNSGIYDMELLTHYQYLYNISWMKLYSQLNKAKQNLENGKKD